MAARHRAHFEARGWDVQVAGPLARPESSVVPEHLVPIPEPVRDLRRLRAAARALRRVVRTASFDVVHCHGPRALTTATLAGIRRPFVTIHGSGPVPSDPAGYGVLRRIGVRTVPMVATGAFTAAPEVPRPWRFVPHASPRLSTLERVPVPEEGPPTFLWLARLDEGRDAATFVRAIGELADHREVRGVIAGSGPHRSSVEELARRLDAPIEFVGHVDPAPLLARAWALVLLSSHEALNFAVQEAMWTGRSVVCSPLPGLTWLTGSTARAATDVDGVVAALEEVSERRVAVERGEAAAVRIRERIRPEDPWPALAAAYADHLGV